MSEPLVEFPSPVGGVPFPSDFVPSIVFAVLYASLAPMVIYRMLDKRSRNILLINSSSFAIERIVIFSLRAVQAHSPQKRVSEGLTSYMQVTIGMGFVSMAQDMVNFTRCVLVNTTKGRSPSPNSSKCSSISELPMKPLVYTQYANEMEEDPTVDHPRRRFWFRRFTDFVNIIFIAAIAPGAIAGSQYSEAMHSQNIATRNFRLRYISCGVTLLCTVTLAIAAFLARLKLPRVNKHAINRLLILAALISTVSIYRLCVMNHTTTSLISTTPGSQNTTISKTTFYVFHMLPEWISAVLLFGTNARQLFGTGAFGDYQLTDETEEQREKRLKQKAENDTRTARVVV